MSATVDITSAERQDVLTVPFASIVMRAYDMDSLEIARAGAKGEDTGGLMAAEHGEDQAAEEDTTATRTRSAKRSRGSSLSVTGWPASFRLKPAFPVRRIWRSLPV
jgi:hypothetical protein